MPPKRMMEDVHDGGEAVDEEEIIQQIKIVIRENSMCEICSCILNSAGALARYKRGSINVKNLCAKNVD